MASCFVSYTAADRGWAEWVATTLRDAGHDVTVQAADFLPGENFVLRMQQAAQGADHTVVILSAGYLASRFASAEWAAAFATDPTGARRALIPVAVEQIAASGLWSAIVRVDLVGRTEDEARRLLLDAVTPPPVATGTGPAAAVRFPPDGAGVALAAPSPPGGSAPEPSGERAGPSAVDIWRLPVAPGPLIGRDDELDLLDEAWASGTNVLTIIAWGGVGKTTLLNHWLARLAADGYRGAERVYAWSFYRQGEVGQLDTSDQFLDAALTWFGVAPGSASSLWERCRLLTTCLQEMRTLLILDGLEGLQHPTGAELGTVREPLLEMLVRQLAALNPGLCVITSRLPVTDIAPFVDQTCRRLDLDSLSTRASIALLRQAGVHGDAKHLEALADQVEGHALSLTLLGKYVATVLGGDASRWDTSRLARAARRGGSLATNVMEEYDRWFAGRSEGQVLALIGLFDRPAGRRQLAALRAAPVVDGLNELLVDLDDDEWAYTVARLREAGLLLRASTVDQAIDTHPLVRQHYRERHAREHPDAHLEGHRRLFEHHRTAAVPMPATLAETVPLLAAVWHGTQAGLTGSAAHDVYWPRIAQDSHHLRDVLGAASSNHEVLSHILAGHRREGGSLTDLALARVLCDQALDLRMMGRNTDAVEPFERSIELARAGGDARGAANAGRHLSQLHLAVGRLGDALETSRLAAVAASGLDEHHLERIACAATWGDIEHQRGDPVAAHRRFTAAGFSPDLLAVAGPRHHHRVVFFISVFRYCDLLVSLIDGAAGHEPEGLPPREQMIDDVREITRRGRALNAADRATPLSEALMTLAEERLGVTLASERAADRGAVDADRLHATVEQLRRVGQRPWLVHGLLSRASLSRSLGLLEAAARDVAEAREVTASDGTVLQGLDCEHEAALLELASGNRWQARVRLGSLTDRVREIGYGRLERRLGLLRTSLAEDGADPAPG